MLNNSREGEHPCFVHAFRKEAFISTWSMMLAAGLLYVVFTILRNLKIKTKVPNHPNKITSPKETNRSLLGHTRQWSGVTPGSALRSHSWRWSGDHMGRRESNPDHQLITIGRTQKLPLHSPSIRLLDKRNNQKIFPKNGTETHSSFTLFKGQQETCKVKKRYSSDVTQNSARTGHTRRCSQVTPRSALRSQTLRCSGNQMRYREWNPVTEKCTPLRTYDDQFINFILDNEDSEIYIQDLTKDQKKDNVLLTFYKFQHSSFESDYDDVDGQKSIVSLSPEKHKSFLLHADDEEQSVKLQEINEPLSDKALFRLHMISNTHVMFECKENPGVFIGVKDNQLALIKNENPAKEMNIVFKIF